MGTVMVQCLHASWCGHETCIHYKPHKPVDYSDGDTCATIKSSCLVATDRCREVIRSMAEPEELAELVPA